LEGHVRELTFIDLDPAESAQGTRQLALTDRGQADTQELLPIRRQLERFSEAWCLLGLCRRPATFQAEALPGRGDHQTELVVRVAWRVDAQAEGPVPVHLERVTNAVAAISEGFGRAAPLHLRHRPHRRHGVLEAQARTLDGPVRGVAHADQEMVVPGD